MEDTDPVKVVNRQGIEIDPVSLAEANELIERGHAIQVQGRAIKLLITKEERNALRNYVIWRDDHICQECGAEATEAIRIKRRTDGGSDWPKNLKAACKECYDKSPDPVDDKRIDYKIKGSLPDDIYYKNMDREWIAEEKIIKFYREFYDKMSPFEKIEEKIANILNNNASLKLIEDGKEFYDVSDFVLVVNGRKVVDYLSYDDFYNKKEGCEVDAS